MLQFWTSVSTCLQDAATQGREILDEGWMNPAGAFTGQIQGEAKWHSAALEAMAHTSTSYNTHSSSLEAEFVATFQIP